MTVDETVPTAQSGWFQRADSAPEQTIRGYLDEHGGQTDASVGHLLTTFGIADGDHTGRQRISDALATAGVGVNPPLAHLGPDQQVRLAIGRSPAVVAQQAMPPSQPNVAEARQRGLRRPVTLAALLLALLVSAVLFASFATIAVLAIDDPGPQGQQGVAGVQGAQGVQGKRGKKGRTGRTGKSGLNGANGANGAPGATRACSNDIEVPLPYC